MILICLHVVLVMEGDGVYFTNLLNEGLYEGTLEDIPTTTAKFEQTPPIKDNNPSSKLTQKQKEKNFSDDKDRVIISTSLNVNIYPIKGTNQTRATFFTRIYKFYDTNWECLGNVIKILCCVVGIVFRTLSKFYACLSQIEVRNQSVMIVHDRVSNPKLTIAHFV